MAGERITIPSNGSVEPPKAGYLFEGWTDGTTTYLPGDTFIMPEHDVTLRAVWVAPTLLYDLNGGQGTIPGGVNVEPGDTIYVISQKPTKDGYDFVGWADGDTIYQPGDTFSMPGRDVTLKATWLGHLHTVTYDLNGGIGSIPAEQHRVGDTVTVTSVVPSKDGVRFTGWSDGTTVVYTAGQTFTMPDYDIKLVAKWEEGNYSVEKAIQYAQSHWNDGIGLCAEFVSRCVRAGGIDIGIEAGTGGCYRAICGATGLEMENLIIRSNSAYKLDNGTILNEGDVIVLWCATCQISPHVVLCGGYDAKGRATCYSHNNAKNNEALWLRVAEYGVGHTTDHKTEAKVIRLSTLSTDKKICKRLRLSATALWKQ